MATKGKRSSRKAAGKPKGKPSAAPALIESPAPARQKATPALAPAMPIEGARLSPELLAQVQASRPTPSETVPARVAIRENRQLAKQQAQEDLRRRREAANAGVPVVGASVGQQAPVAPDAPTGPDAPNGHIKVAFPEPLKYKMLYHEGELKRLSEPIKQRVRVAAQERLVKEIAEAIRSDEKCRQAASAMEACVNEVLDAVQPSLPPGYAVAFIAAKDGAVVCKHAPNQAGKRF